MIEFRKGQIVVIDGDEENKCLYEIFKYRPGMDGSNELPPKYAKESPQAN